MKTYTEILEFDKVLKDVSQYAVNNAVKYNIEHPEFVNNADKLAKALSEVSEIKVIIEKYKELDINQFDTVDYVIEKTSKSAILTSEEVLEIANFLRNISDLKEFKKDLSEYKIEIRAVDKFFINLNPLVKLQDDINNIIDKYGQVKDNASDLLLGIRTSIKNISNLVREILANIVKNSSNGLADSKVVERNNKLCLQVRPDYKNKFDGNIQDESNTQQTIFIEPKAAAELNRKMDDLKVEEKLEVNRILSILTEKIKTNYDLLKNNVRLYFKLDELNAKAKYALEYNANIPNITTQKIIDIKDGHNPLISNTTAVKSSINIGKEFDTLIITGPNTGGKTANIKMVGLFVYMVKCALPITASGESTIGLFKEVLVDIGDDQSVINNLSTFSSHIKNITGILDNANEDALVLLDEIGSGTEPRVGSQLAISIVEYVRSKKSKLICSTHYNEVKEFAFNTNGVENASVEFDFKTLTPTYKLNIGVPGKSNALEIAENLGLNKTIISRAKYLYESSKTDNEALIESVEDKNLELSSLIKEHEIKNKKLEDRLAEQEKLFNEANLKKEEIIKQAKIEAQKIIEASKSESEILLDQIKKLSNASQIKQHEYSDLKGKFNKLGVENKLVEKDTQILEVNDLVFVIPYEKECTVKAIKGKKYEVAINNMNILFKRDELKFIRKQRKVNAPKLKSEFNSKVQRAMKSELDLRGVRFSEVNHIMDKFFDSALVSNITEIRIIHGFGTGAVRNAVYDFLKSNKHVKEYRFGREGEGLNGATIVTLK